MLESIKGIGYGGPAGQRLNIILGELQSTKTEVLTGTTAATSIPVVGAEAIDTVRSCIMFTAGVPSDVTAEASFIDRRASGTLTLASLIAGDTAIVNGKTFTAVTYTATKSNSGELLPRQFAVGANDTATAANLAAAINGYGDAALTASSVAAVVTIRAMINPVDAAAVTAQNAIALGATTRVTRSAATLAGATLTTALRLSTTNSTGNKLILLWAKKPVAAV